MENLELPKRVMLVDDDEAIAEALEKPLRKSGIELVRVNSVDMALKKWRQMEFDVAIIELEFSPLAGLALVQKLRGLSHSEGADNNTGIIIASGNQRRATDDALAAELGDLELIQKPLSAIKLLPLLARALMQGRLTTENSARMRMVREQLRGKGGDARSLVDALVTKVKLPMRLALRMASEVLTNAGLDAEAQGVWENVLRSSPDDAAALYGKGSLLLAAGEAAAAKVPLTRADEVAPLHLGRLRALITMFIELDDAASAAVKMEELVALSPEAPDLKFEMFDLLVAGGYNETAIALCRRLATPAEVVRYYNDKGITLAQSKRPGAALACYRNALMFYPNFRENYRIYFNIALAEANQAQAGGHERALAAARRCLELNPSFEKARAFIAMLEHKQGPKRAG